MSLTTVEIEGNVSKLKGIITDPIKPIQYYLPIGKENVALNEFLGKSIRIEFLDRIHCIACGRVTKKSFQQGHCFPCTQTLASCDLCIVRPERCHFHLGTCREPEWAETHCMIPHIVYLANTSGLKVGITRGTQIPTRWIDQGAIQALPIARVKNRYAAGLLEVELTKSFADKTNWRTLLKGAVEPIDLEKVRDEFLAGEARVENIEWLLNEKTREFQYPILEYPKKINSINLDKTKMIEDVLLGIKGQYLLFEQAVLNIRNIGGYYISLN